MIWVNTRHWSTISTGWLLSFLFILIINLAKSYNLYNKLCSYDQRRCTFSYQQLIISIPIIIAGEWVPPCGNWSETRYEKEVAHCCAIFLCYLGCEIDDWHKYSMSNNRNHLVGQLTSGWVDHYDHRRIWSDMGRRWWVGGCKLLQYRVK